MYPADRSDLLPSQRGVEQSIARCLIARPDEITDCVCKGDEWLSRDSSAVCVQALVKHEVKKSFSISYLANGNRILNLVRLLIDLLLIKITFEIKSNSNVR